MSDKGEEKKKKSSFWFSAYKNNSLNSFAMQVIHQLS